MVNKAILHVEANATKRSDSALVDTRNSRAIHTTAFSEELKESEVLNEVDNIRKRFGIERIMLATSMHDMVSALAS